MFQILVKCHSLQKEKVSNLIELHHHSTFTCMVSTGLKLIFVGLCFLSIYLSMNAGLFID